MQSSPMLRNDQNKILDESMKQNLEHLLLIEKLVTEQTPYSPFSFKNWWPTSVRQGEHIKSGLESNGATKIVLLKQQQQQQQQQQIESVKYRPNNYINNKNDQLNKSSDRIKQLEEDIHCYKNDYSRLEHNNSKQRSIHLEKQLESRNKQEELEKLIADLKIKHKQEIAIKERLENQLDDVLTQCDLKVKGYQQNIKEMQAIIDHNEDLEHFNSALQLNSGKHHQLEVEIKRLEIENNKYRNKLDAIARHQRLSENEFGKEKAEEMETFHNRRVIDREYAEEHSWSDNNDDGHEEHNHQRGHPPFQDGERDSFLGEQKQKYKTLRQGHTYNNDSNINMTSRIPILASRSTSMFDLHNHLNNNSSLRADINHTLSLKNEEVKVLVTKNGELEVELKQAMETIDFLRRQHQDDRDTIKKLSDNNMVYLDQINVLCEENKNLTFQQ